MNTKLYSTLIFKNCLKFSFKGTYLIILTLIIEYFLIYMEAIASTRRILLTLNIIDQNLSISAFSPYYLFNSMKNLNCSTGYCQFQDIYFYIAVITFSVLVIILFMIIVSEKSDNSYKNENVDEGEKIATHINSNTASNNSTTDSWTWKLVTFEIIKYFCINMLDFVTFKILGLLVLTVIFDKIIYGIQNSGTGSNSLVYLIVGVIFLVIFLFCYMFQIENINIMIHFNPQLNYHYDNKFSKNYDYVLLFLKILISLENTIYFSTIFQSTASNSNEKILFFDIIVLISILAFTLKIVYQMVTNESIFYINKKLNTCRLFFLFFNSLTILIVFIFISSIQKSMFLLIVIVSMIIFTTSAAIYFLLRVQANPIYLKDRYISQIILIIHEYFSLSKEDFDEKIIKIHGIHVNCCITKNSHIRNEKCFICENKNLNHFTQNFIKQTKLLITNKIIYLDKEEKLYFKFAKLISAERGWLGVTEEKCLMYKTKLLLERKKFSDTNFLSNLSLFFDYVNVYDKTNETKFNLIKKYAETNQLICSSIEQLQEVFLLFDSNSKKDFYPLALSLNKNKKSIMKNIQFFMCNKNVFTDLYSFIIIRHNFEKLYNCQLEDNDTLHEIENNVEVLNEFFFEDKLINMIYNIKDNQITILNASKQFVKYKKKSLEEIFPKDFRKYGVYNFLTCLKKDYESFNYEYIVQTENYCIRSLMLTSALMKSTNLEEIMIFSKFETSKDDLIIFQEFEDGKNQDSLVAFSLSLSEVLFLHPKWIETLKRFNNYVMLSFDKIFEKSYNSDETPLKDNWNKDIEYQNPKIYGSSNNIQEYTQEIYTLNYKSYYTHIYSKLIKYIKDNIEIDPLVDTYQNEIEKLANANYQIKVRISFKYQILNNENSRCNVYSFNFLKNKKEMMTNIQDKLQIIDENSETELYQDQSQYSMNSNISVKKETLLTTFARKEVENKASELKKYLIATVLINYFLIIFCVVFLAVGIVDNKYLDDLNNLQISFKNFQNNLIHSAINAYISVGVFYPDSDDYSNYLTGSYFDKFKGSPNVQVDLLQYINNELKDKVDVLKEYLLQFQYDIHNSDYASELEGIMYTPVEYYTISEREGNLVLSSSNVTFTEMVDILMNNGKTAFYTFDYNLIYIMQFDISTGVADFSGIYNKNITNAQEMIYELAMNYPNYLKIFKILEGSINEIILTNQNSIFAKNIALSFVLIGLHVLLILISIVIINHLKNSINSQNNYLNQAITPEVSKYMQNKFFILKDLNDYYNEAPSSLINKFITLKKDFNTKFKLTRKKSTKNVVKESSDTIVINKNSLLEHKEKIKLSNLVKPLIKLLFGVFFLYYVYAFSFLGGIYISFNSLTIAYNYFNLMQAVNIYSLNNYILHQTLQFSNQTDLSFSEYLIDPNHPYNFGIRGENYIYTTNSGYIHQTIEIIKQMSVNIWKIERDSTYSNVKTEIDTAINCSTLYTRNDEVISHYVSIYGENKLLTSLQAFCQSFDFMQTPDWIDIIFEADYEMMNLIADLNFANGDYLMIKNVNDETRYFEMLAILSLIFRPAQSYVFDSILIPLINNATNGYLMLILIYLSSKIFVVILIFVVIKKEINDRVDEINDDIKCLLECIAN